MVRTWQHLKFATEAFHYMTEVIADLEIELLEQDVETDKLPEPEEPPIPSGPFPCMPPNHCMQATEDVHKYAGRLGSYIASVMERTTALLTLAQRNKIEEFSNRVIDYPDAPKGGGRTVE